MIETEQQEQDRFNKIALAEFEQMQIIFDDGGVNDAEALMDVKICGIMTFLITSRGLSPAKAAMNVVGIVTAFYEEYSENAEP